ncbi:MAG: RIFT barrel domain-containing protein, partial [Thermoguttaceae bacterium]
MDKHTNRAGASLVLAAIVLATFCHAATGSAAEPPAVLFVGEHDNHVASGLRALQVPLDEASLDDLIQGRFCLFDYSVLVFGIDVRRTNLESMKDAAGAFVEAGGVVLCFRSSDPDPWVPVSLAKDRAYALGEVLAPEHPIFNKPHVFDRAALQAVHGGSIYSGFYELGEGWRPLLSAGKQQTWDTAPSQHKGDHYGIIELERGRGRIVMCQMIPAYAWFQDSRGDANSPGARFFENLVRYALASAVRREGPHKPRVRPEAYAADLGDLLQTPAGWDRLRLDDPAWQFTAKGPFTGKCDRRGVYTIACSNDATQAGNFGQVARQLQIPRNAQCVMLRVYQSDDYCGGQEPKMVGDQRVSTSMNMKEAHRFRQVLIDDAVVVETDVLGRNVQPAHARVQWYDITDVVRGKREVTLTLKVVDRKNTGQEAFPTDCYFACVDLRTDFLRVDAGKLTAEGYAKGDQGMALSKDTGSLSLAAPVPQGQYVVAFRLLDHPYGQGSATITVNGQTAVAVRASADDFRVWWLATPPLLLPASAQIALHAQGDDEEHMVVSDVAFVPAELCEPRTETTAAESPIFKSGRPAEHEVVKLAVSETARATRTGEIASQAVPFGFGRLRSAEQLAVRTSDGKMIPSQVRPFAHWPDGSIQSAVVSYPVDVAASGKAEYGLHFGSRVNRNDVPKPLTVEEQEGHFRIDTGRLLVEIPRDTGQIVSAVSIDGNEVEIPTGQSWGLALGTEDGRLLRSDGRTTTSCLLAERGPLRAIVVKTGKLADDAGEVLDYRYELHFTRGSAEVQFFSRFSNTVHPDGVFIKRLSLALPWPSDRSAVYYAASENAAPVRVESPTT